MIPRLYKLAFMRKAAKLSTNPVGSLLYLTELNLDAIDPKEFLTAILNSTAYKNLSDDKTRNRFMNGAKILFRVSRNDKTVKDNLKQLQAKLRDKNLYNDALVAKGVTPNAVFNQLLRLHINMFKKGYGDSFFKELKPDMYKSKEEYATKVAAQKRFRLAQLGRYTVPVNFRHLLQYMNANHGKAHKAVSLRYRQQPSIK